MENEKENSNSNTEIKEEERTSLPAPIESKKKRIGKNIFRFVSFFACFSACLGFVAHYFFFSLKEGTPYGLFYKEKEKSLDVVMIGSSTIRHGFIPMEMYEETGLTSYSIVASPNHLETIEIQIREVMRKQNPKVVYIDLNGINNQTKKEAPSFVKQYYEAMPEGEAKRELKQKYPYLKEQKYELFPGHNSFRQQSYWETLVYGVKTFDKGYSPMKATKPVKVTKVDKEKTLPIPEDGLNYLKEILSICKEYPTVNFLFGEMPRYLDDTISSFDLYQVRSPLDAYYVVKSAKPYVEEAGFTFLDYFSDEKILPDYIGLDPEKDQYDAEHLNHRGAKKFTKFFSSYLLKNYFNGKAPEHSSDITSSFEECLKKYHEEDEKIEEKMNGKDKDDED